MFYSFTEEWNMKTRLIISVLSLGISLFAFSSCNSPTGPDNFPMPAPSRDLSAHEIFAAEGITSIHFVVYDSVVVNGQSDSSFAPIFEVYFDSTHEKFMQYPSNITVYDLKKGIAWNDYEGHLTYPQLPNLDTAYNQDVQAYLGSWFTQSPPFLKTEVILGKVCNVFGDSGGYREWVWVDHRLPIQRGGGTVHYDVTQTTVTQYRVLEVNVPFSDSLFEPPANGQSAAAYMPHHDARHFINDVLAQ